MCPSFLNTYMENKSGHIAFNPLLAGDIANNLISFKPVIRGGWIIKFSIHRDHNILLVFTSVYTDQTIIRYFVDERETVLFINYMMTNDPLSEHEL